MPTGLPNPEVAAREYERTLRGLFPGEWPRLDLVILGLGSDGHIASLFPGAEALHERTRWVLPVTAPAEPPTRLTLTLPVLTRADRVHLLVAGREKATVVAHALGSLGDPRIEPAASLAFARGEVVWWLDRAAAEQLEGRT
jgi:6-phosphogluconolactonase